ncbi:unnamed protein product [Coregonus sp. 'balchen']|nr:unnamed protein product [Coregonus sp. 'balchen']
MSEGQKKYSATRRLLLKTKLLKKAGIMLVAEFADKKRERESALNERAPPLKLSGLSVQELQDLCKDLHKKIDIVDEARYDMEIKVGKNDLEIKSLTQKIDEIKGSKKPTLKRVKKSAADALLGAVADTGKMKADFTSGLKKKEEVTDWRKNVDAMSGMEEKKIKLLKKAGVMLVAEKEEKRLARENTLSERVPPFKFSLLWLSLTFRELHHKVDVVGEERYDIAMKVSKNEKEIENLNLKIVELKGKKRPTLKRVR